MPEEVKTFMVEDARLVFTNFKGEKGTYNNEGERSFAVVLDRDAAEQMLKDGWNVKYFKVRDEDEDSPEPYISVGVRFDIRPPKIMLITSSSRTQLTQEMVGILDWANIEVCDLICRGFDWDVNGKQGTKAYLQTMFVTVEEDALERKYGMMELPE